MKRRASQAETTTLSPSANSAMAASRPVTLPMAVARNVYGFESVTSPRTGPRSVPPRHDRRFDRSSPPAVWPVRRRRRGSGRRTVPSAAGTKAMPSPVFDDLAELDRDVGLAERVGDDAAGPAGPAAAAATVGVRPRRRAPTTGPPLAAYSVCVLDVRGDRRSRGTAGPPAAGREVVVEPVEDEDRHEDQRQRDDRDERDGQATLEGPRHEPAQAVREPDPTPPGRVSARRRRSRHRGPSGRRPGRPGRPRSSRAGG